MHMCVCRAHSSAAAKPIIIDCFDQFYYIDIHKFKRHKFDFCELDCFFRSPQINNNNNNGTWINVQLEAYTNAL